MTHGFDLNDPLVCEGIIGDGCGGGRIFFIKDSTLFAYDPQTESQILLIDNFKNVQNISKKKCLITIKCEDETLYFDLSKLKLVPNPH
jgi:hypothetical protein